jgi:DNA polymerase-3 subunit gamma/tau
MAHRALALKYRPQTFADLVGQEHVSTVLARAVQGGRVAHGYLFTGARGVGKTTTARILAKALNCERRGQGKAGASEPCNQCTSCLEIASGVSLDVAEIDGASNRGIADVQALREKVRFTPTGGRHRVVIIDEVHQLSNDAFAALIKTLEEPPPHLVFIFATTDPQKVPETIRSRTQRFDFARVPLRKVVARLQDIAAREAKDEDGLRFALTEGAALLIAQKSEGSMRDAVSALDQVVSSGEAKVDEELVRRVLGIPDREAFFELVEAIVRRDPPTALRALHRAFEKGLDPFELAQGLAEHVRHLLVLKVDPGAAELVPATTEDLERLKAQAAGWSEHDLLRLMKIAAELGEPMRDSSQPLIHLEAAVMQMATLEPGESLAALLERLEALERRLGGAPNPSRAAAPPGTNPGATSATTRSPTGAKPIGPAAGVRSEQEPGTAERAGIERAGAGSGGERPPKGSMGAATVAAPGALARTPVAAPSGTTPSLAASGATRAATGAVVTATAVLEDAPRLDETIEQRWMMVVEAINAQKRMLGAFLQESRLVGVSGRMLVLQMDALHRSVVDERENKALVERHVAERFGEALALQCVIAGATPRPQTEDLNPLVDRAIAWFEGEMISRPGREMGRSDA